MALASYTGDYADYFPSHCAWDRVDLDLPGLSLQGVVNHGLYTHSKDGRGFGYVPTIPPLSDARVSELTGLSYPMIFKGSTNVTGSRDVYDAVTGNLNAGPMGLGHLLACGYLGSARIFFCPSGAGMPPTQGYGRAANHVAYLKLLGGDDSTALTHGNYQAILGVRSGDGHRAGEGRSRSVVTAVPVAGPALEPCPSFPHLPPPCHAAPLVRPHFETTVFDRKLGRRTWTVYASCFWNSSWHIF